MSSDSVRQPAVGFEARQRPLTVGHRGASALAPENTVRAFELAIEHWLDFAELDVHLIPSPACRAAYWEAPLPDGGLGSEATCP